MSTAEQNEVASGMLTCDFRLFCRLEELSNLQNVSDKNDLGTVK